VLTALPCTVGSWRLSSRASASALLVSAFCTVACPAQQHPKGQAALTVASLPSDTGPDDWVRLYVGIAALHGVRVSEAEVRAALSDSAAFAVLAAKIRAPDVDRAYETLYLADVDNDGANEYLLAFRNPTGEHNDTILGVFRPQPRGALVEVRVPAIGPGETGPTFHASPFLSLDREGVTMRFIEDAGSSWRPEERRVVRYLWKGTAVRLLDRALVRDPGSASTSVVPSSTSCRVATAGNTFVATVDLNNMTGSVAADGPVGLRRFLVHATSYNATYTLVFQGYGGGDQKPTSESMTPATSVVARLVGYGGGELHLFLDGDYQPPVSAPQDGFTCH